MVVPSAMLGLVGVTWIDESVAEVTVNVVLPDTEPEVAVIVAVPKTAEVASPALLTVATEVEEELQVTVAVRSWLVLSEKMPVAMNCLVVPRAMLGFVGVTSIEASVFALTNGLKLAVPPLQPNRRLNNSATYIKRSNLLFKYIMARLH